MSRTFPAVYEINFTAVYVLEATAVCDKDFPTVCDNIVTAVCDKDFPSVCHNIFTAVCNKDLTAVYTSLLCWFKRSSTNARTGKICSVAITFKEKYDSPAVEEQTVLETLSNVSPKNKANYDIEKEAIHLLLTGIGYEIYSTINACKTAHEMWIAIERLQQGESLNKQDVKTSLFWEFGKFTSRDGELIMSYYSRFYKMMNEMYQNEFNEIRAEKIAKNENLLALVAAAQQYQILIIKHQNECKKPKRVKDYTYHKEKMLLCKQAEKGFLLQEEQADWLEDTDEEVDEQELEAHYIQHYEQHVSINNTCVVEKVDTNAIPDSSDMCDNDNYADQNAKECNDERVVLANSIANLKLDTDEKKIQKQLKKANTSLAHELQECKYVLVKCKSSLEDLIELEIDA
nr:hypothetical protein [Tanacetum cinerariifolium]